MDAAQELLPLMKHHWGYDSFRPLQEEAMGAVMRRQDSLVILPTGGGKSLCFQLPALALEGTAIVVSPLISLMKDQVDALREAGVSAGKLHSGQPQEESWTVNQELREGRLKLLYVSPERLVLEGFVGIARGGAKISFLAIDEAHCVSEWGHDFRPEYRQLRGFRASFPNASLHAFTATATPRVARDIAQQLELRNPRTLVGSFDRPNLFYTVEKRTAIVDQICEMAERHQHRSGIVYCISRKETDATAEALSKRGLKALPYHAGMTPDGRQRNQDRFINDDAEIIVATIAFGMGIDKPDVRYVIHAGMPKSLENYQQESGRAGRDGLAAECLLLYSGQDMMKWSFIIQDQAPDQKRLTNEKLRAVEQYADSMSCRRAGLLRYFGEEYPAQSCGACDVCTGGLTPLKDSLVTAQKILSCVKRLDEAHGPSYTARVLVASKDARIGEAGHTSLSTYGLLKQYSRGDVRSWIEQLVGQQYLTKEGGGEGHLKITPRGWDAIRGKSTPSLLHVDPRKMKRGGPDEEWKGVDLGLFETLRVLRSRVAAQRNLPPYMVFGDRSLREMAQCRPTKPASLKRLHGVGDAKMESYGEVFLVTIREYCAQHDDLATDLAPPKETPVRKTTSSVNVNTVKEEAKRLLRLGIAPAQVASQTGRAASTIEGYLTDMIEGEGLTDISPWIPAELAARIEAAAAGDETGRMRPVFDALGGDVPYWQIRAALAAARNRSES